MSKASNLVSKIYIKLGYKPNIENDKLREYLLSRGININITSKSLESFTISITSPKLNIPNDLERYKFEDFESYDLALKFGIRKSINLLTRINKLKDE